MTSTWCNVYLNAELKATKENPEIVKSRWQYGMVLNTGWHCCEIRQVRGLLTVLTRDRNL